MRNFSIVIILFSFYAITCKDSKGSIHDINQKETFINVSHDFPPELILQIDGIGNGYSSPAFSDSILYITGESDSLGHLRAYTTSGKLLWNKCYGKEWIISYRGSRATPVIDSGRVFISSGKGDIVCYNGHNGEEIWKRNMISEFNGKNVTYGYSMSVAIDGMMLYYSPGGNPHNVVAMDKRDGNLIWSSSGTGERAGYARPLLIKYDERNILALFSEFAFFGIDATNGELLWQHELNFKGELPCNIPVYENGMVYIVAGPGNGGMAFELKDDGRSIFRSWENMEFDSFFGGFVSMGDYLIGSSDARKSLLLVNKQDGKTTSQVRIGKGSVELAGNRIVFYTHRGEVILLEMEAEKLKVLKRFRMTEGSGEHFAVPVYHDNKLYLRHGNSLLVYRI